MIIHQAIYGEVQGKTSGHDLLAASNDKHELFRRVSGFTDLADRPEGGVLSDTVIRGFFAEDHFLLIKSFPDKGPGLRSGRVFSHTFIIPEADLYQINNLSNLFQYFLPDIQKEAKMYPLQYPLEQATAVKEIVDGREAAATNALVEKQPFVWLGGEGYWEWLARIWPHIPAKDKRNIKIGAAFGPSYVKKENLNLLYIPEDAKALWIRHSFRVVGTNESQIMESSTANWLAGIKKKANSLEVLIQDFDPTIDSIDMLKKFEDYGKAYHQLNNVSDLNHLLMLANLISKISPSEKVGIKGKNKLMNAILQAIPDAPINMFIALMYQTWKGFPNVAIYLSDSIADWLTHHLFKGKQSKNSADVLANAVKAETKNLWGSTVLSYVKSELNRYQSGYASVLWQWMETEPILITQHNSWLPDNIENELIQKIPRLETSVIEAVLQMAEQKNWLVLHAKMASLLFSAEKAIEAQLRIDTEQEHAIALIVLSESINGNDFVSAATKNTDARLHRIAGKLILENSKLIKDIDVTKEGWQKCWKAAIEQGGEVWSGISNPQHTLFEILDHLLSGNSFSETLLNAISTGKYSSLKDYPQRTSIWQVLPVRARSEFVKATLAELIGKCANRKFNFQDLESELKKEVQSEKVQTYIFSSKAIPLTKKLQLFDVLPNLREYYAQQLMLENHFSPTEAEELGRLVSKNRWGTIAEELYNNRYHRKDLLPALMQCSQLFGFLQRLTLSASGLKLDAISKEEWWIEFLETAFKLFPSGPEQNGLWFSAGGDLSQLYTTGTGRAKWCHAVQILQSDGKPTLENLLNKMRDTYSENEMLKILQETLCKNLS